MAALHALVVPHYPSCGADYVYGFYLTRWNNVSIKGGTEDNDCKWVNPSADARVMRHIGPLSRGAAIANKIHHRAIEAVVSLLAFWLQSIVINILCFLVKSTSYI